MTNYRFGGYNTYNSVPVITPGTATVSGQVYGVNGAPMSNYPMSSAVNGQMRPQSTTDSSGYYSVTVAIGSTVTISPVTKGGITSQPPRYTFANILSSSSGNNFRLRSS